MFLFGFSIQAHYLEHSRHVTSICAVKKGKKEGERERVMEGRERGRGGRKEGREEGRKEGRRNEFCGILFLN